MLELRARNLHLGLEYSEKKNTRMASRIKHAVYYSQYHKASALGWLELQKKAAGQEQVLFLYVNRGKGHCLIPGNKGLPPQVRAGRDA